MTGSGISFGTLIDRLWLFERAPWSSVASRVVPRPERASKQIPAPLCFEWREVARLGGESGHTSKIRSLQTVPHGEPVREGAGAMSYKIESFGNKGRVFVVTQTAIEAVNLLRSLEQKGHLDLNIATLHGLTLSALDLEQRALLEHQSARAN